MNGPEKAADSPPVVELRGVMPILRVADFDRSVDYYVDARGAGLDARTAGPVSGGS